MSVEISKLPSGLTVITDTMPHLETAALGVWAGVGGRDEKPNEHGISHLLEHMAFKGTTKRNAREIVEEIEAVGGDLNAGTSTETTAYYARVLKDDVPLALDVLADILANPSFVPEELEREKSVIVQEIGAAQDTPDDVVFEHLNELCFPEQPMGRSLLGTAKTLKSFNRENVELVTDGIAEITEDAIVTKDGKSRQIDVLITATGFKTFEKGNTPPFAVNGREGKELATFFDEERYQAYEGISVPRFPNMFIMLGPYAATGASWFQMVENQSHHLVRVIKEAIERGATQVEPKQEAHDRYHADILRRMEGTVFFNNNCSSANSYYFDRHGDAPFMRPMTYAEVWWHSHFFDLDDYSFVTTLPAGQSGDKRLAGVLTPA